MSRCFFELKHPPVTFLWGDSHTHTFRNTFITTLKHAFANADTVAPMSHTSQIRHRERWTLQRPIFFPWRVHSKFHTKIPSTFHTGHKNGLTPPTVSSVTCVLKWRLLYPAGTTLIWCKLNMCSNVSWSGFLGPFVIFI